MAHLIIFKTNRTNSLDHGHQEGPSGCPGLEERYLIFLFCSHLFGQEWEYLVEGWGERSWIGFRDRWVPSHGLSDIFRWFTMNLLWSSTYLLLRNFEKRRWTGRSVPNRRTLVLHTVNGRSWYSFDFYQLFIKFLLNQIRFSRLYSQGVAVSLNNIWDDWVFKN